MLGGFNPSNQSVSAKAAAALTENQAVVLSYSSGQITATAAGAGDRVDGFAVEPKASGEMVGVALASGTFLREARADGAISANAFVYAGATGYVSATANGRPVGVALNSASAADDFVVVLCKSLNPTLAVFSKTASAGDATNGYVEFTHTFGANPAGWIPYATNGSTGAPRVIASLTNTSTSVVRVTVTSLAANDIVSLITWKTA